ncbi:MAG: hypothetical protein MUF18_04100 [Fimbriiglobus sp.]|nr:hypothetical protein [Fimbriiglobus sp.]
MSSAKCEGLLRTVAVLLFAVAAVAVVLGFAASGLLGEEVSKTAIRTGLGVAIVGVVFWGKSVSDPYDWIGLPVAILMLPVVIVIFRPIWAFRWVWNSFFVSPGRNS